MTLLERDVPLTVLSRAWQQALTGQGQVVLIGGEAGLGKTTLVEHFARSQAGAGRVLWGACDRSFTPRPLGPLYDIAPQLGGPWPDRLAQQPQHTQLFSALLAELQTSPVIVVVEDLHWADEATLDLLRYAGRRIGRTQAVLILTYRNDILGTRHPLRTLLGDLTQPDTVRRITLEPLSVAAIRQLIGPEHADAPIDAARLHRQTAGNPFFVTEILAYGSGGSLPSTVRDALLARTAPLSMAGKAVLEAAAVIGQRIEPWLLSAVTGPQATAADECLQSGMLVNAGETFAFRHELARQTVLDQISPTDKMALHRLTLAALRQHPLAARDLARLTHHAHGAADQAAVHEFAPPAARQASQAGAHREAAMLLDLAVREASGLIPQERAELLELLAQECNLIDERQRALRACREAAALWHTLGNPLKAGEAWSRLALIAYGLGRSREAERALQRALTLLEDHPPGRSHALAFRMRSNLHMVNTESREAIAWGERAASIAREIGDLPIEVSARGAIASARLQVDFEEGRLAMEATIALAREHGLHEQAAYAYTNLSSIASQYYQLAVAEEWAPQAIAYASEHGHERFVLYTQAWQAITYLRRGEWDQAITLAETVACRPGVSATARLTALAALGSVRARRGDTGTDEALDTAAALARDLESVQRRGLVQAARAEAAWLDRDYARMIEEARRGLDLALAKRHPWFAGELTFWLWRAGEEVDLHAWLARPWWLHLRGEWRAAAEEWRRLGCPYEQAQALADGDHQAQIEALALFDRLGAEPAAHAVRHDLQAAGARVPRGPRAATRQNVFGLTKRQHEILALLAEGLSNPEIAARLCISAKTANHHVSAVLAKLQVHTRAEAAALYLVDSPDQDG
jgi:ATP/maltotriose-dependent transcriptional regulator MalT